MEDRLKIKDGHNVLFLFTNCLILPQLTFFPKASFFYSTVTDSGSMRSTFQNTLNLRLNDSHWKQGPLPIPLPSSSTPANCLRCYQKPCKALGVNSILISSLHLRLWITLRIIYPDSVPPGTHKQSSWDKPIAGSKAQAIAGRYVSHAEARYILSRPDYCSHEEGPSCRLKPFP